MKQVKAEIDSETGRYRIRLNVDFCAWIRHGQKEGDIVDQLITVADRLPMECQKEGFIVEFAPTEKPPTILAWRGKGQLNGYGDEGYSELLVDGRDWTEYQMGKTGLLMGEANQRLVSRVLDYFCESFTPPLNKVVTDYDEYKLKVVSNATTYVLFGSGQCGPLASCSIYDNDMKTLRAFITQISVSHHQQRRGYGHLMLNHACRKAAEKGMSVCELEVTNSNAAAMSLYERNGFVVVGECQEGRSLMRKQLD